MFPKSRQPITEKRCEPRLAIQGSIRIRLEGPVEREILGRLMDISSNGFRAVHTHAALTKGEVVRFEHPNAKGRARVIWNRITAETIETGFLILR